MEYIGKVKYTKKIEDDELGTYVKPGEIYLVTDESSEGLLILDLTVSPPTFFAATPDHFEIEEDFNGVLGNYVK